MSFISFNEKYYLGKLNYYESGTPSAEDLTEAKRILKILDDLEDEGYATLSAHLESEFRCKSRLKDFLTRFGEKPFPVRTHKERMEYESGEREATEFIGELCKSKCAYSDNKNDFLKEIISYSEWIGYDNDTAYIFLLRDAFLPYVRFLSKGRSHLYPWLIGRAFIGHVAGKSNVDDEIRLHIYNALENDIVEFPAFRTYCKRHILETLSKYPRLKSALTNLLSGVPERKICVVESGYCGTIPMLLSALDERVDFRLYSTAPFLYETYFGKIFCRKYENIRKFETLFVSDALFRFSHFDGKFYVNATADESIRQKALSEIYTISL